VTDDGADRGADRASGTVDGPDQTPLERGLRWLRTVPATLVVFGGMAERRLGVRAYLVALAVAGGGRSVQNSDDA